MINWDEIIDKLDYAFQPIIYAQSGKLYAVEALLRNVQDIPNITTIDDLFDLVFITSPINNLNYSIILYGKNRCKKIITQRVV